MSTTAQAATATLTVNVDQSAAAVNSTQWGHIIEDINHSGEGGLSANLVRNSTMKEGSSNPPKYWSLVTAGAGKGTIATDTEHPLNDANGTALALTVQSEAGDRTVGVANEGFYGVGLNPSTRYEVSFYARTVGDFDGKVDVSLESTAGTVYVAKETGKLKDGWKKFTVNLTTPASTPSGTTNRVVLYANGEGTGQVLFNVVKVMQPTYKSSETLREDLMEKLAGTNPSFYRVPGGNYLEGNTLATRFDWKETIGDDAERPGHQDDAWGYWSTDQLGLKEYLDMAELSGAEPLLGLFAGYTLDGSYVSESEMEEYVQDALDEIEYVIGGTDTEWGAKRAADGHPEPYDLNIVEIGNEDWFDTSGSYDDYRFPMMFDAIREAYPQLLIVASDTVTSRTPDIVDDHYYNSDPNYFTSLSTQYDRTDRNGPLHLIGEYAVTNASSGNPTGTLAGALGEAGFMTGLLRNADVVVGAAYAPALSHVSNYQWSTNLIGFDSATSYASPSYYVQQMFGENTGDFVVPSTFEGVSSSVTQVATRADDGTVYVQVVNPTTSAVSADVAVAGADTVTGRATATVLTGAATAKNSITSPTTVAPTTSTVALGTSSSMTFPANSLTVLKFSVTGAVTPYLETGAKISLQASGFTTDGDSVVATADGATAVTVSDDSTEAQRKGATYTVREGLADPACYSFESRAGDGTYLSVSGSTVVLADPSASTTGAADATFCTRTTDDRSGFALNPVGKPSTYLRVYGDTVRVAKKGGSKAWETSSDWAQDTTFTAGSAWWRSDVDVALGDRSVQPTTTGYTDYSLQHYAYVAQIGKVTAASTTTEKQDATFTVVPGLADSSCYSFQSVNYPDRYLRHYNYQVRLDVNSGSALYAQDATFCAVEGLSGEGGVSFQSYNYPSRYLRHYGTAVWIAMSGGTLAADASENIAEDSTWTVTDPWAAS